MNIIVIGAGAIGSVLGGFMALSGHKVALVGRAPHMEAIRRQGLLIGGIWGEHVVRNLSAFTTADDLPWEDWELAIIATKSNDVAAATKQILPYLSDSTLALSVQNGLGGLEAVCEIVGQHRALGGRVIFGVETIAPGEVRVTVYADKVVLGSPGNHVEYQRIEEIAQAFTRAGIPAEATKEIEKFIWGKVLYNCCLNALSALLEVNYGELVEHEETRRIMSEVIVEIFAVAQKRGVVLDWNSPMEYQDLLFGRLIPDTYEHRASMLQDILNGKRTEIDSMNGAVAALAEQLGLDTPANHLLTRLIKAKESMRKSSCG
jgi:2-dehydropantoate 2-reductase